MSAMTDQQISKVRQSVQTISYPVIIALLVWFAINFLNKMDKNNTSIDELKGSVIEMKTDLKYIKEEQASQKIDIKELKANSIRQGTIINERIP